MKSDRVLWAGICLISAAMLATALFYQYALKTLPCVLCIHARLWVAGLLVLSLIGLITRAKLALQPIMSITALGFSVGLGETAYGLLSTEKGWQIGSCSFDAGLPTWFALDEWIPSVFMPLEPCGYTPELVFGITMAEGLMGAVILVGAASGARLLQAIATLIIHARDNRKEA